MAAAVEVSVPARTPRLPPSGVRTREERTMGFHLFGFYLQGKEISIIWILIFLWEHSHWRDSHCSGEGIIHLGIVRAR